MGPSSWSGCPHTDTSSLAPALQASVRPSSKAPHRARLGGRHGRRRVLGDLLRQLLRRLAELLGRVDDLADHAELIGPGGVDALVTADQGHAHHRFHRHLADETDGLNGHDLSDGDVGIEELGVGRGDDDVRIGHPVESATGADPVDRGDDRLPHLLVPGGEVDVHVFEALAVPLHALPVGGYLGDIDPGLEGPPFAGMHDDPHLADRCPARSRPGRTRRASARSWR